MGKTSDPDTAALATKRQQDFDALIALANAQYKTALVSTNQKDTEKATQAAVALAQYWKDLSDLYSTTAPRSSPRTPPEAATWRRSPRRSTWRRTPSSRATWSPATRAGAGARDFAPSTPRNQAQVYGDRLTIFHAVMEAVTTPTTDKTAATLSDANIAAIKAATGKMAETWQPIAMPPVGLTAEQATAYQGLAQAQTANLAALDKALTAGDQAGILKTAGDIKATFTKLFVQFG